MKYQYHQGYVYVLSLSHCIQIQFCGNESEGNFGHKEDPYSMERHLKWCPKKSKKSIKLLTGVNHDNENFSKLLGQTFIDNFDVQDMIVDWSLYPCMSWYISVSVVSFYLLTLSIAM